MEEFKFIEPMKAKLSDVEFLSRVDNDTRWAAGEKFDGYREQLHLGRTSNELFSSAGNSHIARVPQFNIVVPELAGTVLDCEGMAPTRRLEDNATCFRSGGATDWQKQHGQAFLVAFDLLQHKGRDMMHLPFVERRFYLERVIGELIVGYGWQHIRKEKLVREDKLSYFQAIVARSVEEGHEGVILKDMTALYQPCRRGNAWLKVKRFERLEYEIVGFEQGSGKYSELVGAVVYGKDGNAIGSASGMSDDERIMMTARPEEYIGRVGMFECQEVTSYGCMRHPRWIGLKK